MIINTDKQLHLSVLPGHVQLLTLPVEVRLQILSFALSTDCGSERIGSLDNTPKLRKGVSYGTTNLCLLLVCGQIYHEARLLPFQNNEFAFQRWYGSSTAECLKFLQKLQPWQISGLRSLTLDITEEDLGDLSHVDEVCSYLFPKSIHGVMGRIRPGLQHLSLHVSRAGLWADPADFEALFDLARKWAVHGILRLTSLKTLIITITASVKLPGQTAKSLEEKLQGRMPWWSEVSVIVKQEKSPQAKFEEFARSVGWGPDGPGTL